MKWAWIAACIASLCGAVHAEVRLPQFYGDHMVLQRQRPIPVWGWATPGEKVRVSFHGQKRSAVANETGRWRVLLRPESAGGPYDLQVQGENVLTLRDVLVGDVWLGSGQSNMEWSVGDSMDAAREIAQSDYPLIRHIKVPKTIAWRPADDTAPAAWQISKPANVAAFGAVGYFFARHLHRQLGVPIGIVNASWGGSNLETWLSPQALLAQPELGGVNVPQDRQSYVARYRQRMSGAVERWQGRQWEVAKDVAQWKTADYDDQAWATLRVPQYWEEQGLDGFDGVVWYRRTFELTAEQLAAGASLELGRIDDCDESFVNGQALGATCQWDAQRRYPVPDGLLKPGKNVVAVRVTDTGAGGGFFGTADQVRLQTSAGSVPLSGLWRARVESLLDKGEPAPNDLPGLLFNAMIHPLTGMPIRGVIWYQGESNVPRAAQYVSSFQALIADWRQQWQQAQLPFYFVQLASFLPLDKNSWQGSTWAELRDAQRQALTLPATAMVVATDVGDANDIHPRNKQAVGQRLALSALRGSYGQTTLLASGPSYRTMRRRGDALELRFGDVGGGLRIAGKNGAPLQGFAIAGADQKFVPARARLVGDKVLVSSPDVPHPQAVRYGWLDNPEQANLINRAGLPASPFRTDSWPWLTQSAKYAF